MSPNVVYFSPWKSVQPMVIRVRAYGVLRSLLGDGEVVVNPKGNTLGDLIDELAARHGSKIREELFDEEGNLDYSHALFVSGQRLGSLSDEIKDGEEVVITSIIGGGGLC